MQYPTVARSFMCQRMHRDLLSYLKFPYFKTLPADSYETCMYKCHTNLPVRLTYQFCYDGWYGHWHFEMDSAHVPLPFPNLYTIDKPFLTMWKTTDKAPPKVFILVGAKFRALGQNWGARHATIRTSLGIQNCLLSCLASSYHACTCIEITHLTWAK